jgi:hypothetical protein
LDECGVRWLELRLLVAELIPRLVHEVGVEGHILPDVVVHHVLVDRAAVLDPHHLEHIHRELLTLIAEKKGNTTTNREILI